MIRIHDFYLGMRACVEILGDYRLGMLLEKGHIIRIYIKVKGREFELPIIDQLTREDLRDLQEIAEEALEAAQKDEEEERARATEDAREKLN